MLPSAPLFILFLHTVCNGDAEADEHLPKKRRTAPHDEHAATAATLVGGLGEEPDTGIIDRCPPQVDLDVQVSLTFNDPR